MYQDLEQANSTIIELQKELKNEITGGDSKPVLRIGVGQPIIDSISGSKYFVVLFDIFNPDKHALQNLRATVADYWGYEMMRFGKIYFRDQLSNGMRPPTIEELKRPKVVYEYDKIGSIASNISYPLHTTTFSPELSKLDVARYTIEINWYNGSFTFYINMRVKGDKLVNESSEMTFNEKKIDYKKYVRFE